MKSKLIIDSQWENLKTTILGNGQHHQKQGIASILLQEVERIAKDRSILEITTEASITARPFFEKMGYTICKEQQKTVNGIQFKNFMMKKNLLESQK